MLLPTYPNIKLKREKDRSALVPSFLYRAWSNDLLPLCQRITCRYTRILPYPCQDLVLRLPLINAVLTLRYLAAQCADRDTEAGSHQYQIPATATLASLNGALQLETSKARIIITKSPESRHMPFSVLQRSIIAAADMASLRQQTGYSQQQG